MKQKTYRVISLINYIFKVIEKVVIVKINKRLEETTRLHIRQIGFREKRSNMDTEIEIIHRIEKV